ncbi:uncharacterized protein LOC132746195 [Ruditapes philippinarum]|uniref:uncharacterized protein LOC132746195 n=1 Tax=Ruditapes philippinarum TaxID=129788 RepID=UPI00295B5021|nr:uncharacterized protein LOC132746195 [Ruditapes philippinarum]
MEELGGLPLLGSQPGGNWDSDAYSFEDLFISCWHITSSSPILYVYFSKDIVGNEERVQLSIDNPTFPVPVYYYLEGRDSNIFSAYKTYLQELFQAFGANETTATEYSKGIVNLEIDLVNISSYVNKDYNRAVPIKKLNKFGDKIDLKKIVKGILQHGELSTKSSDVVNLSGVRYINSIYKVLNNYPKRMVASYLLSRAVITELSFLPQIYTNINKKFEKFCFRVVSVIAVFTVHHR